MKVTFVPLLLAFSTYVAAQSSDDSSLPFCDELDAKTPGSKSVANSMTPANSTAQGNSTTTLANPGSKAPSANGNKTTTTEGVQPSNAAVSMITYHVTSLMGVVSFFLLI